MPQHQRPPRESPSSPAMTGGDSWQHQLNSAIRAYFAEAQLEIDTQVVSDKALQWLAQCQRYRRDLAAHGQGASRRQALKAISVRATRLLAQLNRFGMSAIPGRSAAPSLEADMASCLDGGAEPDVAVANPRFPRRTALEAHLRLQELLAALVTHTLPAPAARNAADLQSRLARMDADTAADAMALGIDGAIPARVVDCMPMTPFAALGAYLVEAAVGYAVLARREPVRAVGRSQREDPLVMAVEGLIAIWRSVGGANPTLSGKRGSALAFCQALLPGPMGATPASIRHALNQVIEDLDAKGKAVRKHRQRQR